MFKFGSRAPEFEHLRLVLAHRAPPPRIINELVHRDDDDDDDARGTDFEQFGL